MSILLSPWFTEKDEEIVGSSHSDPIGLEVIWAGFASRLYRNRVNSIANDLRGYTVNLFHHWMVRRLRERREPSWWKGASRRRFQEGERPEFSRMLLVNFEKILLHSFHVAGNGADEDALIGLNNARRRFSQVNPSEYRFELHESQGEILKRQAQLGFSGRYRTPFTRHLELLDPVTGHPFESGETWTEVDALFASLPEFMELAEALERTFVKVLQRDQQDFTSRTFEKDLGAMYVRCFGSRRDLEKRFARFWHDRLALQEGATGWLWKSLPEDPEDMGTDAQALYVAAQSRAHDAGVEVWEIGRIVEVEPFLARIGWIFEGFLLGTNHSRDEVIGWVREKWGEHPLRAVAPPDPSGLVASLSGEGRIRLKDLLDLCPLAVEDLVDRLLEYHLGVSTYRRAQPWVQRIEGEWRRNVTIKEAGVDVWLASDESQGTDPQVWVNGYYVGAFTSLAQAIRRGMA